MAFRCSIVAMWLLALMPARTVAQERADRERALELFQESAHHYREGRYGVAAELLREAHQLHPEPVLLYNLGRALDGLGDLPRALDAYRRYLEDAPAAEDRPAVAQRIAEIEDALAGEEEAGPPQGPAHGVAASGPGPVPFVLAAAGGAGLALGYVLWSAAREKHEDAVQDPVHASAARRAAQAEDLSLGATLSFLTGAALLAGGVAWLTLHYTLGPAGADAPATLTLGPTGLTLTGAF